MVSQASLAKSQIAFQHSEATSVTGLMTWENQSTNCPHRAVMVFQAAVANSLIGCHTELWNQSTRGWTAAITKPPKATHDPTMKLITVTAAFLMGCHTLLSNQLTKLLKAVEMAVMAVETATGICWNRPAILVI